jgi:hypothetical protein
MREDHVAGRGANPRPACEDRGNNTLILPPAPPAPVAQSGFDYSSLPAAAAEHVRGAAVRIKDRVRDAYLATGRALLISQEYT